MVWNGCRKRGIPNPNVFTPKVLYYILFSTTYMMATDVLNERAPGTVFISSELWLLALEE